MKEIMSFLMNISDERQEWKVIHKLSDIVFIVLMATLANADDWQEIEIFCKNNEDILKQYVPLENGIPSHDTMQRVFSSIKTETMQQINVIWNKLLNQAEGKKIKQILCIDGKTMHGNRNKTQEPLHVVSVWSKDNGICFAQKSENSKGKEIPMIKALLDTISVKNQIVTIDAIGTQTEIVKKIKKGNGDYVLAVKANQSNLLKNIVLYFQDKDFLEQMKKKEQYLKTVEKAHSCIETRQYYQTDDIS